jgi:glycosidase
MMMKHEQLVFAVFVLAAAVLGGCVEPPVPGEAPLTSNVTDWRDEVIYQILTDRFEDGDTSNNTPVVDLDDPTAYHGGDWQGIIDRLDYLGELGVTALWISPVVKNVEQDAGFSSYHGYWAQDFSRPNPHFGDLVGLREMVDAAHARNMKVILDVVTNHVGQAFYYDINNNGQPDEFFLGQGGSIRPIAQGDATSDLVRVSEWDPDFDANGIQSWTSLGPSGEAKIEFLNMPEINRVAPMPSIFSSPDAYNRKGRVTVWENPNACGCADWGCPWDDPCLRQQELLGDFPGGLKDLATHRQPVRDALFQVYARWIALADFDGFRIDTVKHVEHEFWDDFCPRIRSFAKSRGKDNFLLFGEVFDGSDELLGSYTQGEGLDSLFNFSQYFTVFRGALLGGGARTCEIARLYCRKGGCAEDPCHEGGAIESSYNGEGKDNGPSGGDGEPLNSRELAVNFISNHDVGRLPFFMPGTWSEELKRQMLHLALGYVMVSQGIPSLYYGVEQGFSGGNDPANRETLFDGAAFTRRILHDGAYQAAARTYDRDGDGVHDTVWRPWDTGNPTFRHIKRLIALRKANVALRRGGLINRYSTTDDLGSDRGLFAFERNHPDQNAVVVANFDVESPSSTSNAAGTMAVGFAPGTRLVDLLDSSNSWDVVSSGCNAGPGEGCVEVTAQAASIQILVAQ